MKPFDLAVVTLQEAITGWNRGALPGLVSRAVVCRRRGSCWMGSSAVWATSVISERAFSSPAIQSALAASHDEDASRPPWARIARSSSSPCQRRARTKSNQCRATLAARIGGALASSTRSRW